MLIFSTDATLFLDASKCVRERWKGKAFGRWPGRNCVSASPKVRASVEPEIGAPLDALGPVQDGGCFLLAQMSLGAGHCPCQLSLAAHRSRCWPLNLPALLWSIPSENLCWPPCQAANGCGPACDGRVSGPGGLWGGARDTQMGHVPTAAPGQLHCRNPFVSAFSVHVECSGVLSLCYIDQRQGHLK